MPEVPPPPCAGGIAGDLRILVVCLMVYHYHDAMDDNEVRSQSEKQFQPYVFDEKAGCLLSLQDEIREKGSEVFSLYYDSLAGYEALLGHLANWQHENTAAFERAGVHVDADMRAALGSFPVHPPPHGKASDFFEFARTLEDYRNRLRPVGRNDLQIGNFLLIALYQHWEDSWRNRIAKCVKVSRDHVISNFWGDLRLLRKCLIHNQGIADCDVENKSELFRWFKKGDEIQIDRKKIQLIVCEFFKFIYSDLLDYGEDKKTLRCDF